MEQIEEQPIKKKRGRPRKTPEVVEQKPKSETKQFPITFKCNSDLEMDLYDHLVNKYYRGAYIKEVLIREMFAERPDLALKYGVARPQVTPQPIQYAPPIQQVAPAEIIPEAEVEPDPIVEEEPEPVVEEPPKIKRGADTLNMF